MDQNSANKENATHQQKESEADTSAKELQHEAPYSHKVSEAATADAEYESDTEDHDAELNLNSLDLEGKPHFLGTPIEELRSRCSGPLEKLVANEHHTVMIKLPFNPDERPEPHPPVYSDDKWDEHHVKMPCSPNNILADGSKEAIFSYYDFAGVQNLNFKGLHYFINVVLEEAERSRFFTNTLPKIVDLALQLPQLCTQPIPLLRKQMNHSITLSQHQVAALLANAFLCTFPERSYSIKQSKCPTFRDVNFSSVFQGGNAKKQPRKIQKLKCLFQYFERVTSDMPKGNITYTRQALKKNPQWQTCSTPLPRLHVNRTGSIETDGAGMLQVNFANRFMGGGALGFGLVQEEIRFIICPELLVARLVAEELSKEECIIMTGIEMYSGHKGYSDSFVYTGPYEDTTPRDGWGRKCTEIIGMDATSYKIHMKQYTPPMVFRDLNKAYCGFMRPGKSADQLTAVATGNWGCGAFHGDPMLKSLLQLMAAAEAKRDICYFTFHDYTFMEKLFDMHMWLTSRNVCVSDVLQLIERYNKEVCLKTSKDTKNTKPAMDLFEFIYHVTKNS